MSLARVDVTEEVMTACMTHALTTEAEEIMGLLLGDIQADASGALVCRVWMAYPQIRTDRRKDRVETSPEQMAHCSAHADRLSRETGTRTRVVGWYHSHPHITVLPSHVDVHTQAMYQLLDPGFIGLIFSVFNADASSHTNTVQVTAFQSISRTSTLPPFNSAEMASLDTPTKQALHASRDAINEGPETMERCEVPVVVVPALTPMEQSLHDQLVVQRILYMEEQGAYHKAISASKQNPNEHASWLRQLHHASSYQQTLCQMVETSLAPNIASLQMRLNQQQVQIQQLTELNQKYKEVLATSHPQTAA